jgi:hypothetical protein
MITICLLAPQAACKLLAQLVAGSTAAKQCIGNSHAGTPAWSEVAAVVRQVSCWCQVRVY